MVSWGKGLESSNTSSFTLEFHYCKPLCILVMLLFITTPQRSQLAQLPHCCAVIEAYQHQLASRPAGVVLIFTCSRNSATGDKSKYCMISDPFPSTVFGKGSATPDYVCMRNHRLDVVIVVTSVVHTSSY